MKKHPIYILFTLLLLLIVASCMRDNNLKELLSTPTFTVEEAKEAFESQVETFEIKPFTTNPKTRGKEIPVITPIWNKGNNYSENSVAYIEVPLNVGLMKLFERKEVNTEVPEDEKYLNTDIRLCVQKGKSETYVFSLVYITGDFSYVIKKKNKIKKLSLSDLSGFSGQIRTFDLKGNLLWGYVYKDGEKVGHISLKDKAESGNRVQTRAVEEVCEERLFEYEECWYTGYEDGEGITWTDVECYYDYGYETVCYNVWVDNEDDNCPFCGSAYCSGTCQDDGDNGGNNDPTSDEMINSIKEQLDKATAKKMGETKSTIKSVPFHSYGSTIIDGDIKSVLYTRLPAEIKINPDLSPLQMKLVLAHEYHHLILFEKTRIAGSEEELAKSDKSLYELIQGKQNNQEIQDAHHQYIGKTIDEMEGILKDAFPNESAEFYKCGKWAGGGVHSDSFKDLSREEQREVKDFLVKNKM